MARKIQAQVRNNVKAPIKGLCRIAWDLFDSAKAEPTCAQMTQLSELTGLNAENLRIELRRWKRFNAK
jgi:hypothetical protein